MSETAGTSEKRARSMVSGSGSMSGTPRNNTSMRLLPILPTMVIPMKEALAKKFAALLLEVLTPEQWAEMLRLNRAEAYTGVCHSHDFCDANEVMAEAFEALGLAIPAPDDEKGAALWSAAWAHAFKIYLQ